MVASVPELTKRTFSMCGKAEMHQLRQIGFGRRGGAEAGAVAGRRDDRFHHGGCGVAEDQRAPGADVVDVLVAVGIPDARALRRER